MVCAPDGKAEQACTIRTTNESHEQLVEVGGACANLISVKRMGSSQAERCGVDRHGRTGIHELLVNIVKARPGCRVFAKHWASRSLSESEFPSNAMQLSCRICTFISYSALATEAQSSATPMP